ncbi:MAG: hypothetical protein Q8P23_02300 [bacterium]|nr:hypothetical protein [bacterium]
MNSRQEVIGGSCTVSTVFGPSDAEFYEIQSWSLKPLQRQEDVPNNRVFSEVLSYVLSHVGVKTAFAPSIAHASANIVDTADLKDKIFLGDGVRLYRNKDLPADGIFLEPNETFVMSAAGCPVITATGDGHMIVAHAGRDSLIDRGAVLGEPTRKHLSVVHAIIDAFKERGVPAKDVDMCMQFSISTEVFAHEFDHPQYGRYNRQLGEFVDAWWPDCTARKNGSLFLNLEYVFMQQAARVHVASARATERLDKHPELAHTHDGEDPNRRNLFIVKRNA